MKPLRETLCSLNTKTDTSIIGLNRNYMNFSWPCIDLYATKIFLRSEARLQHRAVMSDRGRDERALERDEKGAGTRIEFRRGSMGRFWQWDDRIAREE